MTLAFYTLLSAILFCSCSKANDLEVWSPDKRLRIDLNYDKESGTLTYRVESSGREVILPSPVGINTDRENFTCGMKLIGSKRNLIDETYSIPQGKTSVYHNHANELVLSFRKFESEIEIRFRAYDDGVAFGFFIPGYGNIEFYDETSAVFLAGDNFTLWGQKHPNRYGYEGSLDQVDDDRLSIPVLAFLEDRDHFLLISQAATYGHYIQPHFIRSGSQFYFTFPLDQQKAGPVISTLPFESPWRMIAISENDPGKIVESYLAENLNPSTDPSLTKPDGSVRDWVRPGRVMWDYIAGDRDKPIMWIDATAEMGWEYYMADAGFINRFGGEDIVREATAYAASRNVGLIGWAHTRDYDTFEKGAANMKKFADLGLKGAKIDFFDHNTVDENPRGWRDYEDTQRSLQMRDWIFKLGIENQFLLELHGNTMPTGERRRYPHLMTLEGVDGMERRSKPASNDLTIPFLRNVKGPVSYTIIHFERSPGTHAYQMAMSVVYEAGMMIYAEHGRKLIEWAGREFISNVPASWDETRYLDGFPASHIIIARRKGDEWFIGGMTDKPFTANIPLGFLSENISYEAMIFTDDTHTSLKREVKRVDNEDHLSLFMPERGGFAVRLTP